MLIAEKIYNRRLKEQNAVLAREEFMRVMSKFGIVQAYFNMKFDTKLTKESYVVTFHYDVQFGDAITSYRSTISFPEDESKIEDFGHLAHKHLDFICRNATLKDR